MFYQARRAGRYGTRSIPAAILAAAVAAIAVAAGGPSSASDDPSPATWSAWEWYHEAALPQDGASPWTDFILPPAVFNEAGTDLDDLRLVDAAQREIPYVLRIGRAHSEQRPLAAKEIARKRQDDGSLEVNLDLGAKAGEHQEIDVVTHGSAFSRRVELLTSGDGEDWIPVEGGQRWLNRYQVENQTIDAYRLHYPPTRQRYLQVRVFPDVSRLPDPPSISTLTVYHSVEVPGEMLMLPAALGERETIQTPDGPGSAWTIDLGGEGMPCERLLFDVADEVFARSYYMEKKVESGKEWVRIARGQWRRGPFDPEPVEVRFSERIGRWLRLVVIDEGDAPLKITAARFSAPVRQVVFARDSGLTAPLRLYVGNPKAEAPAYDLADRLPSVLQPPPVRATLGEPVRNTRSGVDDDSASGQLHWVVYVVAGVAGIILLLLLVVLVRRPAGRNAPARRRR
jgi:hypothetical protein